MPDTEKKPTARPAAPKKKLAAGEVKQPWKDLAKTAFTENAAMNAAKKLYEKARAELKGLMEAEGVESFPLQTKQGDGMITLNAAIAEGRQETVFDKKKLLEEVGIDAFIEMVDVNKTRAEEHSGKAILGACSRVLPGKLGLSIKKAK